MAGPVAGGTQAAGGVILTATPHYPQDDQDDNEGDSDSSKTDSDVSCVSVYWHFTQIFGYKHVYIIIFFVNRILMRKFRLSEMSYCSM